ncbi:L,D-transpeptidase family protein [Halomonas saccharevitans]|uniref:L,D-transpeptidase family protein n=1 Tax=Halomonas saccharevitans TaxID=416872 RepID=A0ABU3NCG3_9GAMM|nr:L,D-transpeptidase family protein [Halomonas saccharevitans]MDT8878859.1 L,D-transpeptidase family protein [Halomonas saccharevitans]
MFWATGWKPIVLAAAMLLASASSALAEEGVPTPGDLLAERLDERLGEQEVALQAFYAARDGRPAWQETATVAALANALRTLDADGLTPQDYRPDTLVAAHRQALAEQSSPAARARFDVQTSQTLLTALRHLQRGKVDPYRIDPGWEVPIEAPPLDLAAISQAVDARRFEQAFASARPSSASYERLRASLARYRHIARQGGWPMMPPRSQSLRPGELHDDVLLLRERLAILGELEVMAAGVSAGVEPQATEPRRYDERLVAAVERFQQRHLLEVDGIVGPRTRAALNVPVVTRIDQIRVNLERARWLLHGLPDSFVLVDIAGYRIRYFRPDGDVWRSRIVVGRPYRRTPSLRSSISHLTINPTWTVPPTILREDVLPRVRRNLGYLWQQDLMVLSPSGRRLDPRDVDWWRPGNVILRQRAGPRNALGRVVLRFPNDHLVYLHDTPAQALFAREQRAFSSGCIRVQGVLELAQHLFDDTGTEAEVSTLVAAGRTRNVHLERPVPVILHYWTVHPDEEGRLVFRPDVYQRDAALLEALDASPTR